MRKLATACALASLTLAAGCGSGTSDTTATATSSSAATQTSSAEDTSSGGSGAPTVLTGTVGTTADPDAPSITLTDSSGRPVTTLPAGDYSIQVSDLSAVHNFHLAGGTVDETTTVPEITDATFDVTLAAGEYTFRCDPHAKMTGSFTVT